MVGHHGNNLLKHSIGKAFRLSITSLPYGKEDKFD